MTNAAKNLLDDVLKLESAERAEFAHALLVSLDGQADPELEQYWADEIRRRLQQIDNGDVQLLNGDDVKSRLLAKYK